MINKYICVKFKEKQCDQAITIGIKEKSGEEAGLLI